MHACRCVCIYACTHVYVYTCSPLYFRCAARAGRSADEPVVGKVVDDTSQAPGARARACDRVWSASLWPAVIRVICGWGRPATCGGVPRRCGSRRLGRDGPCVWRLCRSQCGRTTRRASKREGKPCVYSEGQWGRGEKRAGGVSGGPSSRRSPRSRHCVAEPGRSLGRPPLSDFGFYASHPRRRLPNHGWLVVRTLASNQRNARSKERLAEMTS